MGILGCGRVIGAGFQFLGMWMDLEYYKQTRMSLITSIQNINHGNGLFTMLI